MTDTLHVVLDDTAMTAAGQGNVLAPLTDRFGMGFVGVSSR